MRALVPVLTAAALAVLAFPVTDARAIKVGQKAKPFQLKHSNGKLYTLDHPAFQGKKVMMMWYEGPKSNKQNLWLKNELKSLWKTGRIPKHLWTSVGICNFQETAWPNFLVWLAIKKEQKKPTTLSPILGDPEGRMMRLYGFRSGRSNIYVFDKNRILRWKSSGPLNRKMGKRLIRLVRRLTRE